MNNNNNIIDLNNILITGSNGMIGKNINFGIKPTSKEMDITNLNSINNYICKFTNICCILHLAAINLRESESNIFKSIDVNINGTINMLSIAKNKNIPFIFISTGAVFSSINNNIIFNENSVTCPNCIYGYTKQSAEKIASLYEKTILIRTGWLFGGNQKNHYKFVEIVINNMLNNSKIVASNDFYGSPTYVLDLINQIIFLLNNKKYGLHHVINTKIANGYDIALYIAKFLNKSENLIEMVNSELVPNAGPKRSKSEVLETIYDYNILRPWEKALKEYLNKYLNDKNIILLKNKNNFIKNIWSERNKCRLCDNCNLNIIFKLEPTPLANNFVKTPFKQELIPLDLCICNNCNHFQLLQIIESDYQYLNYFYVSSTSKIMTEHLQNSVLNFINELNLKENDYILEIGSNDGTCIKYLLDLHFSNIIGIDPAKNIKLRHNLPIIDDYFNNDIVNKIKTKTKNNLFKLIFAFHCCAHIEDINSVFEGIYNLLDNNGTFIMEVGYFYDILKKNLFDTIYHEHIDYHTCSAMNIFANKHNLLLYKIKTNNIQGGSIQFYFSKKNNNNIIIDNNVLLMIEKEKNINLFSLNTILKWKNLIINNGRDINYILNSLISNGKIIIGYGSPAKLTTFMYQYKLTNSIIKYIIDDNIYKQYYYTPGLNIPIRSIEILNEEKIDYIIIFAWNLTDEIINKLKYYQKNMIRIIVPFPELKII